MIFPVYCMKDELTGFMTPTVDQNDASALRNFRHALSSSTSVLHSHPGDFSLWCLGDFDNETGEISPCSPRLIVRGVQDGV